MQLKPEIDLIEQTPLGLYCPKGDFFIDPSGACGNAVVTHAHGDHIASHCKNYISTPETAAILRVRVDSQNNRTKAYGETFAMGETKVTLYPAGHILGAAQVLIEAGGRKTVVTGDYSRGDKDVCTPFHFLQCDTLVTETTFGLPVFKWPDIDQVVDQIIDWLEECQQDKKTPILCAYSLGKAQRLLFHLSKKLSEPVYVHGAYENMNRIYRNYGFKLADTQHINENVDRKSLTGKLVMAPPSVRRSRWIQKFKDPCVGFASGWMQVRGFRRRQGYDRGFIVSDHADFSMLEETVENSCAHRVFTQHGYDDFFARYLNSKGVAASALSREVR